MLKKLITISITAIASLQAATTYNKSLSDGNDNLNYWSDTTSSNLTNHTLVGATEVFTIGSRKNIPNVPTPIKVSTNKLCSDDRKGLVSCSKSDSLEPRYTDDGLNTSGESNLRTWYKANTPKSVNGVVDEPCSALDNTGSVVNWWVNFPSLRCERTITTYTPKVNSTIYTNKVNSDLFTNKLSSTTTTGGVNIYADKVSSTTYSTPSSSYSQCSYSLDNGGQSYFFNGSISRTAVFSPNSTTTLGFSGARFNYYISMTFDSSCNLTQHKTYNRRTNRSFTINDIVYAGELFPGGDGNTSTPTYFCSSGVLSGSTCITTKLVCPDASWSDNGGNCTKVTPIVSVTSYYCPATYSDMGTYCKKTIQICPDPSWTSATATTCSKVVQVCPDASWTDNGANCKKNVPEYKLLSSF